MNIKNTRARHRLQNLVLIGVALFVGLIIAGLAGNWRYNQALDALDQRSHQVLALHKEAIFGLLDKFRLMTVLVARRPDTVLRFENYSAQVIPENVQSLQSLQSFAGRLAAMSGANRVKLALPNGRIIAQSSLVNIAEQHLNVGLLEAALQDRLGRETLFSSGGHNTYAFAASVRNDERIVGIVNIDVDLQVLENAWALSDDLIFVTDETGRFIFGNQVAGTLDPVHFKSYGPDSVTVEAWLHHKNRSYLARGESFPHIGWTLNVLIDKAPAQSAQYNTFLIAALIGLVLAALALLLLQRRQAFLMRLDAERTTASVLEQTVARRTSELRGTNKKLQIEFDERVAAEKALKQAQASLIQSAKLAAIGQMSTALAHEYNQPLAAIRSYADNGRSFLDRGNKKDVDENLARIVKMTERMAALSSTLKTFARKPRTKLQLVPVFALLEEAVLLVSPAAKKQDVKLHLQPNDKAISAMGGQVRLSQVIVNLLSNAIDAVANTDKREVYLSVQFKDDRVIIYVEDTGPGVPAAERHKIFDAFVTSKDVGEGLGLGLSIAYNIVHDFGGTISVEPSDRGGAAFMVSLPGQLGRNFKKAEK